MFQFFSLAFSVGRVLLLKQVSCVQLFPCTICLWMQNQELFHLYFQRDEKLWWRDRVFVPKLTPMFFFPWYHPRFCSRRDPKLTKHFLFVSSPQTDRDLLVFLLSSVQFPNMHCSVWKMLISEMIRLPVCTVVYMCYVLSPGCRGTVYQTADLKRSTGLTYRNKLYLTSPVSFPTVVISYPPLNFCGLMLFSVLLFSLFVCACCLEQLHCPGRTQWRDGCRNARPCLKYQPL